MSFETPIHASTLLVFEYVNVLPRNGFCSLGMGIGLDETAAVPENNRSVRHHGRLPIQDILCHSH